MRYIRSYDFEHRRDCYMEGIVLNADQEQGLYEVLTMKIVFGGEKKDFLVAKHTFRTPIEGNLFMDYEGRIEDLARPDWSDYADVALDTYLTNQEQEAA